METLYLTMSIVTLWASLALLLFAVEMLFDGNLFIFFWFALSAGCVAFLKYVFPTLSTPLQIGAFAVLGMLFMFIYHYFFRKKEVHTNVGQANDGIGAIGTVKAINKADTHAATSYQVQFSPSLLGSPEWECVNDSVVLLNVSDQVEVIEILGNQLRVRAKN